jgi:hypothetical protein
MDGIITVSMQFLDPLGVYLRAMLETRALDEKKRRRRLSGDADFGGIADREYKA